MKNQKHLLRTVVGLVALAMMLNLSIAAVAKGAESSQKKVIKLALGCGKPMEGGKIWTIVRDIFAAEVSKRVEERTNYKIEWNIAFGGTIAKDGEELEATEMGLLDLGYVVLLFEPSKLFLHTFGYWVPFSSPDEVSVNKIAVKIFKEFPEFDKQVEKYNQKFLAVVSTQSYQIITTFPVKTLGDLKGRKIGAGGINLQTLPPIGAVPVQSPIGEGYTSLQAGVYDGYMILESIMAALKWPQVAPYVTLIDLGAVPAIILTINTNLWNKLPKEIRNIMQEAASVFMDKGMKELAADVQMSREKVKQLGGKITTLDPIERQRWVNALPEMPGKNAEEADAKGMPGSKVIKRYIEMQKAAGYSFPRDWKVK
jgi:TRAP-type C4-dicarboxylate transport system substrate-binding protein